MSKEKDLIHEIYYFLFPNIYIAWGYAVSSNP